MMAAPGPASHHPSALDASALIAYIAHETGWENVRSLIDVSIVNTVSWAEVVQEALAWPQQIPIDQVKRLLEGLGLRILDFSLEDAEETGRLRGQITVPNISLAGRSCLAAARNRGFWAVTADTLWQGINVGVNIYLIRVPG
jgi:PIN domain nuclease of toxin-antitoxin system